MLLKPVLLYASTAGEQVEDENDDGENQQKMDPAAHGVTADEAQNPENYENDGDSPKHGVGLLEMCAAVCESDRRSAVGTQEARQGVRYGKLPGRMTRLSKSRE
jgi:hypothetical protein